MSPSDGRPTRDPASSAPPLLDSPPNPTDPSPADGPTPDRFLSDGQTLVLAVGAWAGSVASPGLVGAPGSVLHGLVLAGLVVAGLALVLRRPWLLVVAVVGLAGGRGATTEQGFQPVAAGPLAGVVTLVDDPAPLGAGWRADVRLADGRRVEASGYGAVGFDLAPRLAGDQIEVTGRLRPIADQPWTRARHLTGRLELERIGGHRPPGGARAVVEAVRSRVAQGADGLPENLRPLYLGLVIGDDRLQSAAQKARFRAAGLSHLLAVSGQNVAFLLAIVRPVIGLVRRRARFGLTVLVLVGFALATRAEPSVLRATTTAGLAAWAATGGLAQTGLRLLALAVTGLVLVDPFLVHSLGFRLSVAASAGILVITPRLLPRIRLPVIVAEPLAVTAGAQIAVLPLLLTAFGPVSLASVPANLLAVWAAGAVMTWGLTVGVVAGAAPAPLDAVLQAPVAGLLLWIDGVAAWAGRLPLPLVDARLALLAVAVTALLAAGRWRRPAPGPAGPPGLRTGGPGPIGPARLLLVVLTMHSALAAVPRPPAVVTILEGGGVWLPAGAGQPSVLVVASDADRRLLDALLVNRIATIDVVVTTGGTARAAALVASLDELVSVGVILAPPRHRVLRARTVAEPLALDVAGVTVELEPDRTSDHRPRLQVRIVPDPGPPP